MTEHNVKKKRNEDACISITHSPLLVYACACAYVGLWVCVHVCVCALAPMRLLVLSNEMKMLEGHSDRVKSPCEKLESYSTHIP